MYEVNLEGSFRININEGIKEVKMDRGEIELDVITPEAEEQHDLGKGSTLWLRAVSSHHSQPLEE